MCAAGLIQEESGLLLRDATCVISRAAFDYASSM